MIDLNGLCKQSLANAEQRQKNGAFSKTDTRLVLKHCATEVVEATEAYHYMINEIPKEFNDIDLSIDDMVHKHKHDFASELADIICCVLIIAGKENIDIETAIKNCVEKNRKRAEGIGDKL